MAAIDSLIDKIQDLDLRTRIKAEVDRIQKKRKFGLVYEEHLPEATLLYDVPIKKGTLVTKNTDGINGFYRVLKIEGNNALCVKLDDTHSEETFSTDEIVAVAQFGEAIYPYLKPIDSICNAPDSKLWHTLIEADNYHALQLLCYLYGGMVDCIYIDPPYNTGAKDWKYNNDYVDSSDAYRHSKWLSFMEHRLKIAKKLLNPKDSVLIITIDEKEYLHLGCLLEQMFPEANIQMISSVIAQSGVARANSFYRTNEFIFFVQLGKSSVQKLILSDEWQLGKKESQGAKGIVWNQLRRTGTNSMREDRPNLFYPIIFNQDATSIIGVGESLPISEHPSSVLEYKEGCLYLWPIRPDGREGNWQIGQTEFKSRLSKGYIKWGEILRTGIYLTFLKKGSIEKIENNEVEIVGYEPLSGTVIVDSSDYSRSFVPGTQWNIASHDASYKGTQLLNKIIGKRFDFPKSLYAVHDTLRFFIANKPDALILDFFAGSGSTLHAVNLLNAEDNGNRRCILVTNNEVSEEESKKLRNKGLKPNDPEWEALGIAHYVTWARTKCTILGKDINGNPLKGDYIGTDIPMSEGFRSNVNFFKLGFLDKISVALGRNFKELLPVLWMKAGAKGDCPNITGEPDYIILPDNHFAVLINDYAFADFSKELNKASGIDVVFINTDSEDGYREMISKLNIDITYQLYRDYIDNFSRNKA